MKKDRDTKEFTGGAISRRYLETRLEEVSDDLQEMALKVNSYSIYPFSTIFCPFFCPR